MTYILNNRIYVALKIMRNDLWEMQTFPLNVSNGRYVVSNHVLHCRNNDVDVMGRRKSFFKNFSVTSIRM